MHFSQALIKASIVLIPSYIVAYLTEKMVYVVPMLAAMSFFANTLSFDQRRRIDEEDGDGEDGEDTETEVIDD